MLALVFATFGDVHWSTWATVGAGVGTASLVLGSGVMFWRWRRRLNADPWEQNMPWEELLGMLQKRNRARAQDGLPPEEPTDELLNQILSKLPPATKPEDTWQESGAPPEGGKERHAGRCRWGNPTAVHLNSLLWPDRMHGLVVNRSPGGLGIFLDKKVPPGTSLKVRAAEAPASVPAVPAEVRQCRRIGGGFLLGCEFSEDISWHARVWFG
jgi:hypothetical protein